jgi:serine/threonine protein kinase
MNSTNAPSSLKDFQIIGEIGKGAFGYVYKAMRIKDGQIYALKKVVMNKLKLKEKENSLNEIRILASISHPNVIAYKEAFYDPVSSSICIVMEFADNGDLEKKIEESLKTKSFMTENEILGILRNIVIGLKALHDKKIMHRDIKAANIFMFKNDCVKIGDLNVSKVVKMNMIHTQTGTPYYASPEVWNDKPYDYKSDIWSLGCLLYEMTTLKAPFRGTTMKSVFQKIMKGIYDPLPSFYSKFMNDLINVMLQIRPNNRPTCEQILDFLENKQVSFDKSKRKQSAGKSENYSLNQNYPFFEKILKSEENQKLDPKLLKTIKLPKKMIDLNIYFPKNKYESKNNRSFEVGNKIKFDKIKDLNYTEENETSIRLGNEVLSIKKNEDNITFTQNYKQKNDINKSEKFLEDMINNTEDLKLPDISEICDISCLDQKKREEIIKNRNYHYSSIKKDESVLKLIQKPILIRDHIFNRGRELNDLNKYNNDDTSKIETSNFISEGGDIQNPSLYSNKVKIKILKEKEIPLSKKIFSIKENYNSFNRDLKKHILDPSSVDEKIKQMQRDQHNILKMNYDSIEISPSLQLK